MKTRLILSFLFIILSITACNTTEPPPPPDGEKPTLALALDDASCTEAWLQLTTKDLELPAELTLKQYNPTGDSLSKIFLLNTQDSLLYIDSLLPNQSYQYQVSSIEHPATSNELSVTTMDTTSHNFTFEMLTFGTIGSSTLYDVAIINENNIWAVGEILIADTSQNGYTTYNAVHWDGIQWELMRIPFLFQGDSFYSPIYAVFAFGANDIWFGIGNLIHWDGTKYWSIGISSVFPSLVNKIWGSSSSDLYVVGNNGNIVHYNGTRWSRIESGTELNINDIWGDYNEKTNEWEILAVASN
ncbi:MAG: glucosyl transferase, partial [Ignavibacteriaceae bacterium]|nr:glucosyl transferase [Ignavibacteriaceae bacterium]